VIAAEAVTAAPEQEALTATASEEPVFLSSAVQCDDSVNLGHATNELGNGGEVGSTNPRDFVRTCAQFLEWVKTPGILTMVLLLVEHKIQCSFSLMMMEIEKNGPCFVPLRFSNLERSYRSKVMSKCINTGGN